MMLLLRFGPRSFDSQDDSESQAEDTFDDHRTPSERFKTIVFQTDSPHADAKPPGGGSDGGGVAGYGSATAPPSLRGDQDFDASIVSAQETTPMVAKSKRETKSVRKRASLASLV